MANICWAALFSGAFPVAERFESFPLNAQIISYLPNLGRLDAGLQQKLTLLSAPAGFGKTTLAVEWIQNFLERVAWVSLDPGDNDPARFWRYVITAIQAFNFEAGCSALARLHAIQPPHYESVLTVLINAMAHRSEKNILVLEDYHIITNSQVHQALAFLLSHLPPVLHLVLLTRSDPPLPLARLAARIEGWAAGLRLVVLAMQGKQELGEIHARRAEPQQAAEFYRQLLTVKSHLKSIYRKLNVNSRRTARAATRRLNSPS